MPGIKIRTQSQAPTNGYSGNDARERSSPFRKLFRPDPAEGMQSRRNNYKISTIVQKVEDMVARGSIERAQSIAISNRLSRAKARRAAVRGLKSYIDSNVDLNPVEEAFDTFLVTQEQIESLKRNALMMLRRPVPESVDQVEMLQKEWKRAQKIIDIFGLSQGEDLEEVAKAMVIRAFRGNEQVTRILGEKFRIHPDYTEEIIAASLVYIEAQERGRSYPRHFGELAEQEVKKEVPYGLPPV